MRGRKRGLLSEASRTITHQSDLACAIGLTACGFMAGVVWCFGALVWMGVL